MASPLPRASRRTPVSPCQMNEGSSIDRCRFDTASQRPLASIAMKKASGKKLGASIQSWRHSSNVTSVGASIAGTSRRHSSVRSKALRDAPGSCASSSANVLMRMPCAVTRSVAPANRSKSKSATARRDSQSRFTSTQPRFFVNSTPSAIDSFTPAVAASAFRSRKTLTPASWSALPWPRRRRSGNTQMSKAYRSGWKRDGRW